MSNIRGIGDFENQPGGSRNRVPLLGQGLMSSENPRKEPFFSFIKNFICPLSTWKSVIFAISMIDIIVYIVTLCFGIGISTPTNPYLLPPLPGTLEIGSLVKKYLLTNFTF
jgi:hypothetical protein